MQKGNSRSILFLTELIIAILIFALCMGICGGVFARSFAAATTSTNLSKAVFHVESAAEAFHSYSDAAGFAARIEGTLDAADSVFVYYDKDWEPVADPADARFTLSVEISRDGALETAEFRVFRFLNPALAAAPPAAPIYELTATKNRLLGRAGQ
ncbi:MAG: hypothetical protein LBT26_07380 [Clostridiales Family XIII bacterium]|jgi:hypothetical protein|nr:hypothetical protein [Clostridiales Family XIII bacterium]